MASFSRRKFLGSSAASLAVPGDISVEIPEPETSSTSEGFAGSAVDFRYAPRFSQATICFPFRPCVRNAVVCSVFSLAGRLPSVSSASGRPALFRHFFGSTRPSDSPSACMSDLSSWPSQFLCIPEVSDCSGSFERSHHRTRWCSLPPC